MSKSDSWRPRLHIDLTPEQFQRLQKSFPWGVQQAFWREIVDDVIDLLERKGEMAIAVILNRALKPREVLKSLKEMGGKEDSSVDD